MWSPIIPRVCVPQSKGDPGLNAGRRPVPTFGQASLATLEYASRGIPVVTTRFSGLQRISQVGIEVPPRDTEATASAIIEVLTSPELRERAARNAPDVLERHNWRNIVGDFMDLYEEMRNLDH